VSATTTKRESILSKVRKMLDLAEGSDKQGEIDAALAQAQKLMTLHAIEQAELDKLKGNVREQIIKRKVSVGPSGSPISSAKGNLSVAVAELNRCRVYRSDSRNPESGVFEYTLVFVGYESDVDFVEMLWTSLSLQMDQGHDKAKRDKREWVNGRTFRKNFNDGFVGEAWRRLREIKRTNEESIEQTAIEAAVESGTERASGGTALVLRNREREVEEFLHKSVGKLSRRSCGRSSYDGHATQAGRSAASKADYSGGRTGRIGARGQIEA
jgi:hypothetical protein